MMSLGSQLRILFFWPKRDCPKLDPPLVEKSRGRPPSQRKRDIIEKRKQFTRSNTRRCSVCKKFGPNLKSHQIRRAKDELSYPLRKTLGERKKLADHQLDNPNKIK